MRTRAKVLLSVLSVLLIAMICMVGCSSDSSSSTPTVSGVAAAGAPLNGIVYIKGAGGNTASTFIGAAGTYSFTPAELATLTTPYIVYAEGVASGQVTKIYSAGFNLGRINITPLTDFIIRTALAGDPDAAYTGWNASSMTLVDLTAAETAIQAQIQPILNASGNPGAVNLLTISFNATGSGLDAVLDVVDISFSGNVATVTNVVTGTSYTDDVTDPADSPTPGFDASEESGTQTAMDDAADIQEVMQVLVDLYATSKPSGTVINTTWAPHMATEFLGWGQSKTTQLNGWINDNEGPPVGMSLALSIVSEMSGGELAVHSYTRGYWARYNYSTEYEAGSFVSGMVYDGTEWLWYGDQRWIDIHIEAVAHMDIDETGTATYSTGITLDLQDSDNYAGANSVQSALIVGQGLPTAAPGGVVMQKSGSNFNIFGSGGSHYIMDDTQIGNILSDNTTYTIYLFDVSAATVDGDADPVTNLSGNIVATYTDTLTKKPILNTALDPASFPVVTAPTGHTEADANILGTLPVTWTNTASAFVRSISLSWSNGGTGYQVENRSFQMGATSASIDSSAEAQGPDNNAASLNLYGSDIYGRRYDVSWAFLN